MIPTDWTVLDNPDSEPVQNGLSRTVLDASDSFQPA